MLTACSPIYYLSLINTSSARLVQYLICISKASGYDSYILRLIQTMNTLSLCKDCLNEDRIRYNENRMNRVVINDGEEYSRQVDVIITQEMKDRDNQAIREFFWNSSLVSYTLLSYVDVSGRRESNIGRRS